MLFNKDALWVQMLRSKYRVEELMLVRETHQACGSHLWREVRSLWDEVCKGLTWSVGNGTVVRFWQDS